MNITLEQYNTVLDGLRNQLQLHVAYENYLIEVIKTSRDLGALKDQAIIELEEKAKQLEQLKSENFNLSKELNTFTEAYNMLAKNKADLKTELDTLKKSYADLSVAFESKVKNDQYYDSKQ